MDLRRELAVSPQLDALLKKAKDALPIHTPRKNIKSEESRALPQDEMADLPNNIDTYPFSKYVAENFNDPSQWGVLSSVLKRSLTRTVSGGDERIAIAMNRMILRIMIDKNLAGAEFKVFCDFLINKIQSNYHHCDEALCQIASLTWNNYDEMRNKRLWVLLSNCLSCIMPTNQFFPYLLKYVSDHAIEGYKGLLQQKLLRMPLNHATREGRLFPPSILEWQTNHAQAPMSIKIHLPNDTVVLVEVNSWTTAEDAANRAIESITGRTSQGWSLVLVTESKQMFEVSGHDYLFDLFAKMEVSPELDTPPDEFLRYGSGVEGQTKFNPPEFLEPVSGGAPQPKEVPVDVPLHQQSRSGSNGSNIDSNFSFGPPNIRISNQRNAGHRQVDPETGGVAGRIKGGGRMMGMGGMNMQPQMVMQPQMMPMQGMTMQQPMMQQPMMQQPMMQQPMMQQPMMQPMMQPMVQPMMQQPMMQQPMMQQPMMQQPMMQQPFMQQPMMQPMMQQSTTQQHMPGSVGALASAMDSKGEQTQIMKHLEKFMKQQEENQKKLEKLEKESLKSRNSRRDYSSDEDRKPYRRGRYRRDSSEDERKKPSWKKPHYTSKKNEESSKKEKDEEKRSPDHGKSRELKSEPPLRVSSPQDENNEDVNKFARNQGTVRMSFIEKRKFFMQKMNPSNDPPPRRQPAKITLPVEEEREVPKLVSGEESEKPEHELQKTPSKLYRKDPEEQAREDHAEALRKIKEAKKKSQENRTKEEALLNRQRREAAGKQGLKDPLFMKRNESSSMDKNEPVKPGQRTPVRKLTPQRMTPVKTTPIRHQISSDDESEDNNNEDGAMTALQMALMAKRQSEYQPPPQVEDEESEEEPTPYVHERSNAPPLPPMLEPEPESQMFQALPTDANTQTVIHPMPNKASMTYANVSWRLFARKEIFFSGENFKNDEMQQYILRQVMREAANGNPRILQKNKDDIKGHASKKLEPSEIKTIVKKTIENWPIYFTRIFRIKVTESANELPRTLYKANAIGIGLTGLHFINWKASKEWNIQSYGFSSISQLKEHQNQVFFNIEASAVTIFCRKASELGKTLRPFMVGTSPRPMSPVGGFLQVSSESEDESSIKAIPPQEEVYAVVAPPEGSQLTLEQYGQKYFKKKTDVRKSLEYSKTSLTKTLHEISDQQTVASSLRCFKLIQQFMGDIASKGSSPEINLKEMLMICFKFRGIILDEVCIYLAKQTTNNKKRESLLQGWRLFAVFLAFFRPSDGLLNYLLAHLHTISNNRDEISKGGSNVCLVNLQQTLDYGGRKHSPSEIEIKTLMKGRATYYQQFIIPGMDNAAFLMNTSSVVADAVKYFCNALDITSAEEMKEFAVFELVMDEKSQPLDIRPQRRNVYLLDITSQAVKEKRKFMLMFQRVVWKRPINYDNQKLVQLLFYQVVSDYTDGKLLTFHDLTENLTRVQIAEITKLATLIHRGMGHSSLPTQDQVKSNIPQKILGIQSEFVWKEAVHKQFTSIQQMSPETARSEVLATLNSKPMFGSSFFSVEIDSKERQMTKLKMIAINPVKVCIMDIDNHNIESEISLTSIADVSLKEPEQPNAGIVEISLTGQHGPLRLKARKAAVIAGILIHHIHI